MDVNVVTVIPLSRSLPKDHLTYFSTKKVALGDVVEIPIRKQVHKALVVNIENVKKQKALLKDASFELRAIKKVLGPSPFSSFFLTTLHRTNAYFLGNEIQLFSSSIPQTILDNLEEINIREKEEETQPAFTRERLLFQQPHKERVSFYKTYIRESFARGESVRFCVPTISDANHLYEELSKGIGEYCFVFHSKKTPKKVIEDWNKVQTTEHPVCLIHTPQFLCIPRHDSQTSILEHESSPHYQSNKKPFIDGRILFETHARISNSKLILGDTLLRTETLARHKEGEFGLVNNLYFRIDSSADHTIIDMRKETKDHAVLSQYVVSEIEKALSMEKKVLLFSLRAGLATTTVCNDCGTTLTHEGSPLTLMTDKKTGERFFKSKKHNEIFRTNIVCQNCGGWNLNPLGVGTEKIEELVQQYFGKTPYFRIDQNENHTPKKIETLLKEFYNTKGPAILITSPLGIPHLSQPVDVSCIVSLDTLFNIPQFNMYEKIMHIIMDLSIKTHESLLVQTRYADQKIVSIVQNKKLLDFFEYDYEERKHWEYPPFSTIIKMSYEGPLRDVPTLERYLKTNFTEYELYVYHSPGRKDDTKQTHAVIKIKSSLWPLPWKQSEDPEKTKILEQKLLQFPPSWTILVNPHNLL
jgi:primosomal protein N' (replication factor Y)